MRKKIAVVALSLLAAFSGIAPAQAFPSISPPKIEAPKDVQQVQYWRDRRGWGPRGHWDRGRRWDGPRYHRGPGPGAIIGGLAAGAIIGGMLAQPRYESPGYYAPRYYNPPRRYVSGGSAHVRWCYDRYRSYRAYDNTFQPNYGPRRLCHSPYR